MPWFKVDDGLVGNKKFARIPRPHRMGATGLWTILGSWCSAELTDGHVPAYMVAEVGGTRRQVEMLVNADLWEEADDGWQFVNWCEYQPTREAVEAERRAGAARQQVFRSPELRAAIRARDGDVCRYCGRVVQWSDRRGPAGGTYDHIIPDGPTDLDNLAVCCRSCNSSKGRRTPAQAGLTLSQVGSNSTQIGPRSDLDPQSRYKPVSATSPTRPDPTRKETTSPTERGALAPVADLLTAQGLVTDWIDALPARPPGAVVGQVAKRVGVLIGEGIPHDDVRRGLQAWQTKGLHPSALDSVVHEIRTAGTNGKTRRQAETDSQFDQMLAEARERDQHQPPRKAIST